MNNIFWFRRDLRLIDNTGLFYALSSGLPVIPVFIFDPDILSDIKDSGDARVTFIYDSLLKIKAKLNENGSDLILKFGNPIDVFTKLFDEYTVQNVYANCDYEPYSIERDTSISKLCISRGIKFQLFKDQVIFEKGEIVKSDGKPYTIFTPYSKSWKKKAELAFNDSFPSENLVHAFFKTSHTITISLDDIGFKRSFLKFPSNNVDLELIRNYHTCRDIPSLDSTSHLGIHLRFGTISTRELTKIAVELNQVYLNELIWREFFKQILFHFPEVVTQSFKKKYDRIEWVNDKQQFNHWCEGKTGYPFVDAGMRQLNMTGFMHNRVRMVVASFLCKHLLIDWRWGESYFAEKLLDYEMSSNNGNWQWAAGTGCDAAPYFRVFNPIEQQNKFDKKFEYIKMWCPEFGSDNYPQKMIDHDFARRRCIETYKKVINH